MALVTLSTPHTLTHMHALHTLTLQSPVLSHMCRPIHTVIVLRQLLVSLIYLIGVTFCHFCHLSDPRHRGRCPRQPLCLPSTTCVGTSSRGLSWRWVTTRVLLAITNLLCFVTDDNLCGRNALLTLRLLLRVSSTSL